MHRVVLVPADCAQGLPPPIEGPQNRTHLDKAFGQHMVQEAMNEAPSGQGAGSGSAEGVDVEEPDAVQGDIRRKGLMAIPPVG